MGEYDDNRPITIFNSGNIGDFSPARRWVEAENTSAVFAVIMDWYNMLEAGIAELQYPDPAWRDSDYPELTPLTPEHVDQLIAEIDADFEREHDRFPETTRLGPDFGRLRPHARMAFAQAIYRVLKSEGQMEAEARSKPDAGEALPPAEALPL